MSIDSIKSTGKMVTYAIGFSALILGTVNVLDHGLNMYSLIQLIIGGTIGIFWYQEDQQRYTKSKQSFYPTPDRSNFTPNQKTRDFQLPEGDLSQSTGTLIDARPYHLERWWQDDRTLMTLFFSVRGIETSSPDRLLELVSPILKEEGIPTHYQILSQDGINTIVDASGNRMYSLTFIAGINE